MGTSCVTPYSRQISLASKRLLADTRQSVSNRKIGRARYVRERLSGVATEDETLKAALENYHARMQRVLDHIDQHLDDDLGLEALSGVAAFSKFHFHRQFTSTFGVSVHRYVQLARSSALRTGLPRATPKASPI
ncbi:hypothetical protein AJ88_11230 [Mesorhizobium amorphae CCBAU 01583]|nr:hypothetical protein AJ88_11230 [Mesorhizobium amorphae CCBAU 01583]